MSGIVGIVANDVARFTFFASSLSRLISPPGTTVEWAIGSDRIRGRNRIIETALDRGAEWVLFLDDDHAFGGDLLMRLLAHEQDLVTPIYLQRAVPFAPVVYTDRADDGTYKPLFLPDIDPDGGLVPVRAAGTGGLLIRSEVIRAVRDAFPDRPWFEHGVASEDLIFCEKARDAGFQLYCDPSLWLGHLTTTIVWPHYEEDDLVNPWQVGFTVASELSLRLPIGDRVQLADFEAAEKAAAEHRG